MSAPRIEKIALGILARYLDQIDEGFSLYRSMPAAGEGPWLILHRGDGVYAMIRLNPPPELVGRELAQWLEAGIVCAFHDLKVARDVEPMDFHDAADVLDSQPQALEPNRTQRITWID